MVLTDNEWRRVKPYPKVDQARERTMDAKEAKKVLAKLSRPLKDMAKGSLLSGCRFSELQRLTVADVERSSLCIRKITTKAKKVRHIPLNKDGADFFKSMCEGKANTDFVFEQMSRNKVSRGMKKASTLAKLKSPVVFHDSRRSYGSMLLNAGESADVIQELLGHADVRTTRKTYAHMIDKTVANAVKSLPSIG